MLTQLEIKEYGGFDHKTQCLNCDSLITECTCGNTETVSEDVGPVCPYCSYQDKATDFDILWDEETSGIDCGGCGRDYDLKIRRTITWIGKREA